MIIRLDGASVLRQCSCYSSHDDCSPLMDQKELFSYVRALGALACIVTLNVVVLIAFLEGDSVPVPRWSIYMLIMLIGGLLGLDALLDVTPVKVRREGE